MPEEMMPHLFIPLPEGFMPPEDGSDFIEAAFAAIDGGDGELTLEELIALLPPPEGDEPPPPPEEMPPHLMIPLPEDFVPPPPEDGPEAFIEAAFALIAGEDGVLILEELLEWLDAKPMNGNSGISEGDEGLAGLPYPPACSSSLVNSELLPQQTGFACNNSQSVGNLIFRTVCNADPYRDQAISLPDGRAADCFGIEAIKGTNLIFEIFKESDGTLMYDNSMGKNAFETLVLIGEPGGTVYRIKLFGADTPDARMTIRFIDHPTF